MQAVHEMLLQSWSPTPAGATPGLSASFRRPRGAGMRPSFADLRAEGGHRVSARRERNATTWFRLVAGQDGLVRIRDNFGGRTPKWSRSGVRKVGDNFELTLKKGQFVEATLPEPPALPPAPPNAAEPVVIK